jgi:hypothetical protein
VWVLAPHGPGPRGRPALALFSSTCVPLVAAITTIGVEQEVLGTDEAAALVGAATLSVLLLPLLALKLRGGATRPSLSSTESETW